MFKYLFGVLGSLMVFSTALNIAIKLFGSNDAVRAYAGSSRNLDTPILGLAIGLVFLAVFSIVAKLEDIEERLKEISKE